VTRPFEIGRRLFRAELLRLSESEHVLVLVGHAIVIEQTALRIILKDLAELYGLFSRDQQADVAPLTLQWTDYLALSDTDEAGKAHQQAEEYWQDVFKSGIPRLELPADSPRPPIKKYSSSRADLKLAPDLNKRLQAFAESHQTSPQAVLFAAFTTFIHRLSGSDDLVVGAESESLYLKADIPAIANTRNMLPLRTKFDATRSFKEHIHFVTDALAKANAHRNLSLSELIQLLHAPRDQSRSPIFTVAFRSQSSESAPLFEGLESEFILPPSAGARYDIELIALVPSPIGRGLGEGAQLICDFSTELFEAETISRWLNGIVALLVYGLQDATQACGLLPMMPPQDREMVSTEWNQTERPFARDKTLLDLITEQAQAEMAATAIRFGDASLTYGKLIQRVEQIASALHQRGIKHGDRVGILMRRSLDLLPAMLAVWRMGAHYVPMDIGFPKSRIAYMLTDSDVQSVITNKDLTGLLEGEFASLVLCVEDVDAQISTSELPDPATGSDSAYIIYTSGSMGQPKGVQITHSALLNCLLALREYQEFTPASSMLALTTISFDVSANELFMPLIAGGCVDLAEDGLVADGLQIVERIASRKPSHIQLTASTWKSVLTAGWEGDKNICLASCGEAISRELAEQLLKKCRVLWNFYGPTETTVYSTAYQIESEPDQPMRIGRPLPNTQIYILDKQFQPVPIGAVGDLYIAGAGLAVGYWQRPELTNERFVASPFSTGERMYYTGDLARYFPNGDIICLGRLDDQVKIHGVRVELGEVESALRGLDGVSDAVVVAWQDSRGDMQLVGHVIADQKDSLSTSQIRTQLRERLPEVMIPPYILFAEKFPKTANGKVQRAALPSPEGGLQNTNKIVDPPSTT
ncbi:MAG TPA: amino acid adenylation domain-containing protein, partial [Anaerolineales bacterium]|nr:amino acid adenylation domain-containing protein [Anaerolineales bacterium]